MPRHALAALLFLAACTGPEATPSTPPESPAAAPAAGSPHVRLAKVSGEAIKGRPPKGPLLEPAEQIRRAMTRLYTAAFFDPSQWDAGFPAVLESFAREVRDRARRDVEQLTVGSSAGGLAEVRPVRARVVVRFLPNENRAPVAAIANMRFQATGVGEGFEVPIRHTGEYVLRPVEGRWLITGYEVQGRIGP